MDDVLSLSAIELANAIRSRRISPVELVNAVLNRIEERADLNAFVTVTHQEAREAAREAEKAVVDDAELPALHGLPFSVKDSTLTKGVRTTFGSAIMANFVPDHDAVPVARAKQTGGILIGRPRRPSSSTRSIHQPSTGD
jgi:aspartyl-tRNA(Asn)/glutamyl-tRNA(Gln) amidotransferase subunit A